jgi:methylated-DNA-protein-cysteine methyltransferase-like protein
MPSDSYSAIYGVVSKIPRGRLATYGQIADLAGLSGQARQVGYALHATPEDLEIPWQRVINAKGEVSGRSDPLMIGVQQSLLESEGVVFDERGRCDLARYRWQPRLESTIATELRRDMSGKTNRRKNRLKEMKRPA